MHDTAGFEVGIFQLNVFGDFQFSRVQACDFLDNRQPQTAAAFVLAQHTVKRLKYLLTLMRGNSGAIVEHVQMRGQMILRHAHGDIGLGVVTSVINQVFDQFTEHHRLGKHRYFPIGRFKRDQ